MKIIALNGSPNGNGNTSTLLGAFQKGLPLCHFFKEYKLYDMDINHCVGCWSCMKIGKCRYQDDMDMIYEAFQDIDVLVLATPIYWWHMTSKMKCAIDRFSALLNRGDKIETLRNKEIILIVTYNFKKCGDNVINMIKDFEAWLGARVTVLEYCSKNEHVSSCEEKLNEAYELAGKICTRE
ncbi:MAG: flavodoxin family protein [Bacillota bacterium]